ncbi:MAG: MFS transporter [Polyangiales bacterium]
MSTSPTKTVTPSGLSALPRVIWLLGAVSLLTDTASDLVYPLIPELLRVAGGGPLALGALEGIAELVSSVVKVGAGRLSDRSRRPGRWVVAGYGLAAISRPLLGWVTAPWQAMLIRTLDRAGKGLRSAPRDAILAASAGSQRGLAFGVHRALDNLGAVCGATLAFLLLRVAHWSVTHVVTFALLPGLLSTLLCWIGVGRRGRDEVPEKKVDPSRSSTPSAPLPRSVRALLGATFVFALAGAADSFLLARLHDLGLAIEWLPLAWLSLQLAKVLLNVPGGALADRLGPRVVLIAAWAVYAIAYVLFAIAPTWPVLWALLPFYALHYGLGEGAEKSLMSSLAPQSSRGFAFGMQNAVHGLALLPANLVFGLLYAHRPSLAFGGAAAIATFATIVLLAAPLRPTALASSGATSAA